MAPTLETTLRHLKWIFDFRKRERESGCVLARWFLPQQHSHNNGNAHKPKHFGIVTFSSEISKEMVDFFFMGLKFSFQLIFGDKAKWLEFVSKIGFPNSIDLNRNERLMNTTFGLIRNFPNTQIVKNADLNELSRKWSISAKQMRRNKKIRVKYVKWIFDLNWHRLAFVLCATFRKKSLKWHNF